MREVYDSDNSEDMFRMELERALEVRYMSWLLKLLKLKTILHGKLK